MALGKAKSNLLHPVVNWAGYTQFKTVYSAEVDTNKRSTSVVTIPKGPFPTFVIVLSDNVYVSHRERIQRIVNKGKFKGGKLEIYNQSTTALLEFEQRFKHRSPVREFDLHVLYCLLEPKDCYVRATDYDDIYQMSRLEEALFLLKDAGAYKIILDTKLYEEVSNSVGKKLNLSVPVATPIGSLGSTGSDDRSNSSSSNVAKFVETEFCEKPEYMRTYDAAGKWFYVNGLQVPAVQMAIKAIELGENPATQELTLHFVNESSESSTAQFAIDLHRALSDTTFLQSKLFGVGKSCQKHAKAGFHYSFKVIFFSNADMEIVKESKRPEASAVESLRLSGSQLANLRHEFYDGREKFREDIIVHLAQGNVLMEELTTDAIVEDTFAGNDALMTKLVDLFAGEGGSVKEWLEAQGLGDYHDKFVEHGFDTMVGVAEIKEDHLTKLGVTKSGHRIIFIKALKALNDSKEQRRRNAERRPAALHELAQAAFYMRQAREPSLTLLMQFTLYGPDGSNGANATNRTWAIFTWQQAIFSTPLKSMSANLAAGALDEILVPRSHKSFCKDIKFKPATKRGQSLQGLYKPSREDYGAIEHKHYANIIVNDSHKATDPFTDEHEKALPFGLLVLVIDYSLVAAAQTDEKAKATLQALVNPLLGETFDSIEKNKPPADSKSTKHKVERIQAKRGTLKRYPPLAALLVDNNLSTLSFDEDAYKAAVVWFKAEFYVTNVFVLPRLVVPTSDDIRKFHSNISFKTSYIENWNKRAYTSLSVLRAIIDSAAEHEQQAIAMLSEAVETTVTPATVTP